MMNLLLYLLVLLDQSITGFCKIPPKSDATLQIINIIENPKMYNKHVVPYENLTEAMIIQTALLIRNFQVDDVSGVASVDLNLRLYWRDNRIKFATPDFSPEPTAEIERMTDSSLFWLPDVFFRNSFHTVKMESVYPESFIEVSQTGSVMYSGRFILKFTCPMNLKSFPYDSQECKLFISSYAHTSKEIILVYVANNPVLQQEHIPDTGQKLALSGISRGYCENKTPTGAYPCLKVTFQLVRIFHYYLIEFYIPSISLVMLAFLSEILDVSLLVPRLVLSVGAFFGLGSLVLFYTQTIPRASYITALDVFAGVSLLFIQITILHVLLSYCVYKPGTEDPEREYTLCQLLWKKLKDVRNGIVRILIVGSYFVFLYCYFNNYGIL